MNDGRTVIDPSSRNSEFRKLEDIKDFISVENEIYTSPGILQNYTAGYFNTTSAIDAFKFSFSGFLNTKIAPVLFT